MKINIKLLFPLLFTLSFSTFAQNENNYPVIYVKNNKQGQSLELKEGVTSICNQPGEIWNFCGHINSYSIPKDWIIKFYVGDNYQGYAYTRADNYKPDENEFIPTGIINSIQVVKRQPIDNLRKVIMSRTEGQTECRSYSRLLRSNEIDNIDNMGGNFCYNLPLSETNSSWKFEGEDGKPWSYIKNEVSCIKTPEVPANSKPLCVINSIPTPDEAFLFQNYKLEGTHDWQGQPEIAIPNSEQDRNENSWIKSFVLGDNVILEAYLQPNFKGKAFTFTKSEAILTIDPAIRSYILKKKPNLPQS